MPRALVVDDALTVRLYHCAELEKGGFDAEAAANGYEALERCLAGDYALLVVDINMPVMDGYAFLEALRSHPDAPSAFTPVIMVSTEDQGTDADRAYAAGANVFLTKPVEGDLLRAWARMLADVPAEAG